MTLGVFDFIVIGLAVILGLVGLKRGFRKTVFGLFASLIAVVAAIVLAGLLSDLIINNTAVEDGLVSAIAAKISPNLTYGSQILEYKLSDTGDGMVLGFYDNAVWHDFADVLTGSKLASVAKYLEGITVSLYPDSSLQLTFPAIFATWIVATALDIVLFAILYVVLMILLFIINRFLKRFTGGTYIGHFIDKVLGVLLGLVVAWIIIMIALVLIELLSGFSFMSTVTASVNGSVTGKYLVQYNFLYQLLDKMWGIGSLTSKISGLGI